MGLNMNDLFPSKWLKAEEFEEGEKRVVTIKDVTIEEFEQKGGKKEDKPVMAFYECKPMVLNKTNASIISHLYGPTTDGWIGKKLTLFTMEVDSFGDIVTAIRIKNQVPRESPMAAPPIASAPQQTHMMGGVTREDMERTWAEIQQEAQAVGLSIKGLPQGDIPLDRFQDWQLKAREQINAARPAPVPVAAGPSADPFNNDYDDSDPFADS